MSLMHYWRFSNPHRLVLPPLMRVQADIAAAGGVMPVPLVPLASGSTMGATLDGMGGSPPHSYSGSPLRSLQRQGTGDSIRQFQTQFQASGAQG
jgi:hypothetical protein